MINIHHLHVWTLSGDKIVGTVHIKLINVGMEKFNEVSFFDSELFLTHGGHLEVLVIIVIYSVGAYHQGSFLQKLKLI